MSGMTPDKALMIVDPDTREAALTGARGCRPLRAEYIAEACRVLAADYRKLREGLGLATAGLAGALAEATAERDAAVRDLKEYGTARGFTCEVCTHKRGTKYTPCFYPNGVDVDDKMCRECGRCKCGYCDGVSQWEWRGLVKENKA